jgi:hypothetical protein
VASVCSLPGQALNIDAPCINCFGHPAISVCNFTILFYNQVPEFNQSGNQATAKNLGWLSSSIIMSFLTQLTTVY